MSLDLSQNMYFDRGDIIKSTACIDFGENRKEFFCVVCSSHPNEEGSKRACETINSRIAKFTPLHQLQIVLTYCTLFDTYLDNLDMDEAMQDSEASFRKYGFCRMTSSSSINGFVAQFE
ncbi:hypothetical protein L1D61_25590 [Vibrio mediterranei]|uniref:Uncharacterized protein n=1 Tax=Vibrio mediterranei TaxID=689 RepID=A0A3G4VQA7_9VIBR|nr:hypothetical protein [Vibrio mediterranei]AYV25061.1 hypothetical protein ECB94_27550 [Vibrio mediterranei]MCG9790519.1 hypothetical protein [Vibrio mediterranei]